MYYLVLLFTLYSHKTNKSFELRTISFEPARGPTNRANHYRWSALIIPSIPHYTLLSESIRTKNFIAQRRTIVHISSLHRYIRVYIHKSSARYCLSIMIIKSVTCHQQSNHSKTITPLPLYRITLWKAIHSVFVQFFPRIFCVYIYIWSWLKFRTIRNFMDYSAEFIVNRALCFEYVIETGVAMFVNL